MKNTIIENKISDVKFGKNVIEILSTALYRDPYFIFREYIQNAADSIREAITKNILEKKEAQISLTIDEAKRLIVIEDNGCGIRADKALEYLINIGDSSKDPNKNTGHYGIGRMGGAGYCKTLRFETSYQGELTKSIVEFDAEKLNDIINDASHNEDASSVIKQCAKYKTEHCDENSHFFIVTMEGVPENHLELLDVRRVRSYLEQIAPVPFNRDTFRFCENDIYSFLKENSIDIDEYDVYLNGDTVYKCYSDSIIVYASDPFENNNPRYTSIEINKVYTKLIKNKSGKTIGWFWVAGTDFEKELGKHCQNRGLRLRQWNIQIGEADCLSNTNNIRLWPEKRGNNYFVGEIYVLDVNLRPNARRDYFIQNSTCREFEDILRAAFIALNRVYRDASKIHTSNEKQQKVNSLEKENSFISETQRLEHKVELRKARETNEKAQKEKRKIENFCLTGHNKEEHSSDFSDLSKQMIRNILDNSPCNSIDYSSVESTECSCDSSASAVIDDDFSKEMSEEMKDVLEIVRQSLKDSLKANQYNKVWNKIWNEIKRQFENN